MSLDQAFRDIFTPQNRAAKAQDKSYLSGLGGLFSFGGGNSSGSISPKAALTLSAFFNGVDQISNDIAKIPFAVYKKEGQNRLVQADHAAHWLLSKSPNALMTSFIFKKTMGISLLIKGNALAHILEDNQGNVVSINYINWDDVIDIRLKDGVLIYHVRYYSRPLLASEVIHIKNFAQNGIVGVGAITYGAQQLNLAIEVQKFSATSFQNKGVRQGVIETDKTISKGKLGIIEGWRKAMGEKSPDRIVVLDDGLKFKPINITPQELELIAAQRFSVEDIARWLNINPHKIKSLEAATNNNIEQQTLDHASDTIQPHITNIEEEFAKKLLSEKEIKAGFFVRGNMNVLLRADYAARGEYYSKMVNMGVYNRQEVRRLEDQNDGPIFLEEYLTPVNTYTESQIKQSLIQKKDGNKSK